MALHFRYLTCLLDRGHIKHPSGNQCLSATQPSTAAIYSKLIQFYTQGSRLNLSSSTLNNTLRQNLTKVSGYAHCCIQNRHKAVCLWHSRKDVSLNLHTNIIFKKNRPHVLKKNTDKITLT